MTEPQVRFDRMPAEGTITGTFAADYGGYLHRGVDVGCVVGTPVVAPAGGTVVAPYNDGSFGIAVCLSHGDGWYTLYAHLSRADVSIGEIVAPGTRLGLSGNTGKSTGPHLHWQLSDSFTFPSDINRSRNPLDYFEEEDMTEAEDNLLAVFSGSEEATLSREQRLANARYRRDEIAAGKSASVNDRAASAIVLSKRAIAGLTALAVGAGALGPQVLDIIGGLK